MFNSDGYILLDFTGVDITKSNQYLKGIYQRVINSIDTNKLALVINAGNLTPQAAIIHKRLNFYVITTSLYIFTVNSNDIIIIEQAGQAQVDVAIVPTLTEGVKLADFTIGAVEGSIYAPEFQTEINDNVTASNTTWSSNKIDAIANDLSSDISDNSTAIAANTAAITAADTAISNLSSAVASKPDIDDTATNTTDTWSSDKIAEEIAAGAGVTIDDTTTSTTKTWSSDKINSEVQTVAGDLATLSGTVSGNTTDITNIQTALSSFNIRYATLESGVDVYSPSFSNICLAFIGRQRGGIYIGSGDDVQTLVQSANISIYKIGTQLRITNTGSTTSIVCFLYK